LSVKAEHVGKKCKCPSCGILNLITGSSATAVHQPPSSSLPSGNPGGQQTNPFSNPGLTFENQTDNPFSSPSNVPAGGSPYQAPMTSGQMRPSQIKSTDMPGTIGVVCGGLSLFFLVAGVCFSPAWLLALLGSIAGLLISFFGKQPLKTIGISLNAVALFLCALLIAAVIVFFVYMSSQQGF